MGAMVGACQCLLSEGMDVNGGDFGADLDHRRSFDGSRLKDVGVLAFVFLDHVSRGIGAAAYDNDLGRSPC